MQVVTETMADKCSTMNLKDQERSLAIVKHMSRSSTSFLSPITAFRLQVVTETMGDKYIAMKLKDQERSLSIIEADPELKGLTKLRGPLLDLEVRGTAPLQYFGDLLWAPAFDAMAASKFSGNISAEGLRLHRGFVHLVNIRLCVVWLALQHC